jgi:hypothetical protein
LTQNRRILRLKQTSGTSFRFIEIDICGSTDLDSKSSNFAAQAN